MSGLYCRACNVPKPESDFYMRKRQNKGGTWTTPMLDCKSCTIKRHGTHAKATIAARQGRRGRNRALIQALKDGPCMDCGGRFPPVCMDFDHTNQDTKTRAVSAMVQQNVATIKAEVAKCELVCSNCHRIRTAQRGYPRPARNRQ